jgi:hypothetical protein
MNDFFARLKPFDPRRENAMRVFVLGHLRFDQGVWLPVDSATADTLRGVHQNYYDPLSPTAFEICARQEAVQLGIIEKGPDGADSAVDAVTGIEETKVPAVSERSGRKARES